MSKRYVISTWTIGILTAIAAMGGLFIPDLYQDNPALIPILRGQDLVTLFVVPLFVMAASRAWHGSKRALLIYMGFLSYLLYTYAGAAFAYSFNRFILVYIVLFSLSFFTLFDVTVHLDANELRHRFDVRTPRTPIALFLMTIALTLGLGELAQVIPFLSTGELPQTMKNIGATTYFVYVLDLGFVIPLSIIAAVWLLQNRAWGYVLSACMLIKAMTMGFALLSMTWVAVLDGQTIDGLTPLWLVIAFGGLGYSFWMLKHLTRQFSINPLLRSHYPADKALEHTQPHLWAK